MKALAIASEMVVAKIATQEDIGPVVTRIVKKTKSNKETSTFCFETMDQKPVKNFHYWFEDLNMIGRHYLMAAASNPNLMRQYTVCNTMIPEFYNEIIKVCQFVIEGKKPIFDQKWFEFKNENRIYLTLKNYKVPTGLSAKIHAQKVNEGANFHMLDFASSVKGEPETLALYKAQAPEIQLAHTLKQKNKKYLVMMENFVIKGPMGKGLCMQTGGVHVAFAAGTGALVFLDLVTRIILHNAGIRALGERFEEDFKFVFYISH